MTTQSGRHLTTGAERVLRSLAQNEATYRELLIRMRPMSEDGLLRALYELLNKGYAYTSKGDGLAWITDLGREAL